MKKFLAVLLVLCAVASVMFFGCRKLQQTSQASSAVSATAQAATNSASQDNKAVKGDNTKNMPTRMQQILTMNDKDLSETFAAMDIVLGDDFLFKNASDISSEELYEFYRYIVQTDEYPHDYLSKYSVKEDKTGTEYKIPVKEINSVLSKYFDGAKFDPSKVTAADSYDKKNGVLKVRFLGCGGMRFARVCIKEAVGDDTLRITVDYFDDNTFSKVDYTKIYTIKFSENGYKYVSVINK